MPSNSSSAQTPSPLDNLREQLIKGAVKVWDVEETDPVIEYQKLFFLRQLVERTNPQSKLAYQICHYMEADYLEIDGIEDIFPASRAQKNAEQKSANKQRKAIMRELELAKSERDQLVEAAEEVNASKKKKKSAHDLDVHIEGAHERISELEAQLENLEEEKKYKDVYPMKSSKDAKNNRVRMKDWKILNDFLIKKTAQEPEVLENNVIKNTSMLCEHLGFSKAERDALLLMMVAYEDDPLRGFMEALFSGRQRNAHTVFAKMIGVERDVVSAMFRSNAPLVERGILFPVSEITDGPRSGGDEDYGIEDVLPDMSEHLCRVLREPDLTIETMLVQLIGEPATTHLDWDKDFSYLGKDGEEFINLLKGAQGKKLRGINLLLYGVPGTGKTEAIKAAAKKAGLELYIPGEKKFGDEPSRQDRLMSLILASELLSDKPNAAILADEMDDLFPAETSLMSLFGMAGGSSDDDDVKERGLSGASKVFMNRLLEDNKTMTFWAANKPEKFDPAFRRRVLFSMEFRVQPAEVRAKLWASVAQRHGFSLSSQDAFGLAAGFAVAPGLMDNAIRHAHLSGGGIPAIQRNLGAAANLLFRSPRAVSARNQVPKHYDARFLNAAVEASDFDLPTLAEKIKGSGHKDFSMLLHGPAGTGKTEYLAYFANLLDMDVMICSAADLGSMYHSESERKIMAAFAEAEASGRFLIIDEADTFLRRRGDLLNNFEVSGVNTMLTCMERHPMPFGCTTNLYKNIDGAAKRRFTFNIRFDTLTPAQRLLAYEHFFGRPAPQDLPSICSNLVPADFVKVNGQKRFIGGGDDDGKLVRLLSLASKARLDDEQDKLYGGNERGFGFVTPASTVRNPK